MVGDMGKNQVLSKINPNPVSIKMQTYRKEKNVSFLKFRHKNNTQCITAQSMGHTSSGSNDLRPLAQTIFISLKS